MGRQARMKRAQHELRQRARRDQEEAEAQFSAPEVQAKLSEMFDAECAAHRDRDAHDQFLRLRGRGWKRMEPNGDGIGHWLHKGNRLGLIHSIAREVDGNIWAHVSVSTSKNTMPTWNEVRDAGWLMYPGHYGIIVVAPLSQHVSITNTAHVWYCLTQQACPDFTHGYGSI
jgi:hypothetical protein